MYKIAIIGAGQLGSRHLQALLKINVDVAIEVVDPSDASLELAKQRAAEIPANAKIESVRYLNSITALSKELDVCIIATTANVRFELMEKLVAHTKIKYFVLEKILFQKFEEYQKAEDLLIANGIKAWVNCPRRLFPVYQQLKSLIIPNEKITYTVIGGEWGLACNAIHFIDHLSYLNANDEFEFDLLNSLNVIEGKRKGYYELVGSTGGKQNNGSELFLHSRKASAANLSIQILTDHYFWQIDESKGELKTSSAENGWKTELTKFSILYQSELSNIVCEDLLMNGTCGLTPFKSSSKLHLSMLKEFAKVFVKELQIANESCPIT
ncbi:Gfo/Idh/MocA family oxidoreductase [Pedobacter sp. CCM 8938]|uniref:Gfo/Idh/MocA family oxidoreductase n=2 Tax=Pedobacter fastidiosus TaxID=2765361 RepID=A0ABR7KR36_9SPHI|nr:Gfo/Idh/MocA family oxidoreductase [Pedobacter fastidiosus]MBC6110553.1 Gfo/Idh/MocA family oxidoreductase [Pedobacter fastidiosus]